MLLVVVGVLASVVFGVVTASVESSLGPHEARYDVTGDSTVTVDLGPLGELLIDSPLPLGLGVTITVHEIPASFVQLDQATTLSGLSQDLDRYVQFFSAPQTTISDVTRALLIDAGVRAVTAFALLVVAWSLLVVLLGRARREELAHRLRPHERQVALGSVLALVLLVVVAPQVDEGTDSTAVASPVFDGTPLEGAQVTGRLGGVIDTYGASALATYRDSQAFYEKADTALKEQWDATSSAVALAGRLAAPGGDAPTGVAASAPDLLTVVVMSDLHCNVGMAPLVTTLVKRSGASLVLDAGDTTMNGTAVEQYCVSTFAKAVPKGVDLVVSPGNHDSADTSAKYAKAGAHVLHGEVTTVDGLRILGDRDPNETRAGQGTSAGQRTEAEEGADLAATACDDDDGVDLLLIHTPWVGDPTLDQGCAPAQISGHLHKRVGPAQVGQGIRYVSSSSAGATLGQPTVGKLHGTAELTVLHWNPQTRRFVDYQVVQIDTDATAHVLWPRPWPVAVPVVEHDVLAPGVLGPQPTVGPTSPATPSPTPSAAPSDLATAD